MIIRCLRERERERGCGWVFRRRKKPTLTIAICMCGCGYSRADAFCQRKWYFVNVNLILVQLTRDDVCLSGLPHSRGNENDFFLLLPKKSFKTSNCLMFDWTQLWNWIFVRHLPSLSTHYHHYRHWIFYNYLHKIRTHSFLKFRFFHFWRFNIHYLTQKQIFHFHFNENCLESIRNCTASIWIPWGR